jgi:hypothetical protein
MILIYSLIIKPTQRSNYIPNCFKLSSSSSSKKLYNNSSKCTRYSNSNNNDANNKKNIEIITHTIENDGLTQYNHCDDNNIQSRDNANTIVNSENREYVDEYKWHSTEAYSYFLPNSNDQFDSDHYGDQETHLKDILRNQLTPLRNAWLN